MKLLIVVKSIDGGTGTFVNSLQELKKFPFNETLFVKTLCLERPKYRRKYPQDYVFLHGSSFYPEKYGFSIRNALAYINEFYVVRTYIYDYRPDIILSIDIHCNLLLLMNVLTISKPPKLIINNRINLSSTLFSKSSLLLRVFLKKIVQIFYKRADSIVSVSNGVKQDIENYFDIKSKTVIPNGVCIKNFVKKRNGNKTIILSVGRINPQKDHRTLVLSFSKVLKQVRNCYLMIVGDGPQKKEIINLVKQMNLSQYVHVCGWDDKIDEQYKKADLFVLSSKREGFPNVLLEAMSYGIPVISTNALNGPRELLGMNKYGILVPVGDKDSLFNSIRSLLVDKELFDYYSKKSLERAKFYTKEKMLSQFYSLINNVHMAK